MTEQLQELIENGDLMVDNGHLSREEVIGHVALLNPPAEMEFDYVDDNMFRRIENANAIHILPVDIQEVLATLTLGPSAGADGWTFNLIKAVFYETDDLACSCELLCNLCNQMLAGRLHKRGWLRCKTVLIKKPDNGGLRPLCIGQAFYRMFARIAARAVRSLVVPSLSPMQLGTGVAGGCEIASRMGQLALQSSQDMVIISIDCKNAFGSIHRKNLFDGIASTAPGLLKWLNWAYGDSNPLYWGTSLVCVGENATGCRQGDPLSTLAFCAGLQSSLCKPLVECMRSWTTSTFLSTIVLLIQLHKE
jgi:hypothetical protein